MFIIPYYKNAQSNAVCWSDELQGCPLCKLAQYRRSPAVRREVASHNQSMIPTWKPNLQRSSGSKSLCMPILAVNTCANLALQLSGTTSCRYSDESAASLLHPKHPGIVYLHRYIIARIGVVLARHSSSFFLVYLNQPVCYACNSQ
jgi:hypothetical protein